jgi:hypothetical protein
MTRARALLGFGSLCIALAGCASHGDGPSAAGPAKAQTASMQLTLDTPIGEICDDPRGRAALDRNLPGLRKNPNYFLFQGFSLRQLASMSGGRITQATLESVRLDLAATPSGRVTPIGTR